MQDSNQEKSLSIKELQRTLREREKDLRIKFVSFSKKEKDILSKTVKLSEEVGELANDILATMSLQRKSKLDEFRRNNLYEEFADIIISTLVLANVLKVDMDRAVANKVSKILKLYIKDRA